MARVLVNGVHLNVAIGGSGAPLLLLHGFTGSLATWQPFQADFRRRFTTVAVDLLGHGRSDAPDAPDRYGLERASEDLATLLRQLRIGPAGVLGYSLGGRIALRFALDHPSLVERVVLESASAGIGDREARAARAARDRSLAERIESEGVAAFVDFWEAQPIFASHAALAPTIRARLRAGRLANSARGLAGSLRGAGQGAQEPLHQRLPDLGAPTLLVVGELDAPARERANQIAARAPRAPVATIAGAGHAPHLERPAAFRRLVLNFVNPLHESEELARAH
jgi:2-succinyl-6-hydroxy-2,4-cyclohexadiene-1-carboxylate synthase